MKTFKYKGPLDTISWRGRVISRSKKTDVITLENEQDIKAALDAPNLFVETDSLPSVANGTTESTSTEKSETQSDASKATNKSKSGARKS